MSRITEFYRISPAAPAREQDEASRDKYYRRLRLQAFVAATLGYSLYYVCRTSLNVMKKPILDVLSENAPETHRKEGEKLKLAGEKVAHEGAFTPGNGWQEVRFAAPVKGRFFCLEALSPQANNYIAAIAEFDVLGAAG